MKSATFCYLLHLVLCTSFCCAFSPYNIQNRATLSNPVCRHQTILASNFYDDFEDFGGGKEEDDDDDDDDEDDDDSYVVDDAAVEDFRSRMGSLFGESEDSPKEKTVEDLISFATSLGSNEKPSTDWAIPSEALEGGMILVANPAKFCTDFGQRITSPNPALLSKFGLTLPPPADLGPDRRADLLPVLALLERHPLRGSQAVLLNRRTGYLLGDLEQPPPPSEDGVTVPPMPPPRLGAFMIQPLWFGGTSASGADESSGLDMLHMCPTVQGAKKLTDDGLFWGGDPAQAQEAMNDPVLERVMTGFDFKFFVQSTRWLPLQLEKEVRDGTWFVASVSKEVLFKSRDRMGTRRAKPLWTEIMELMGEEYKEIRDRLYEAK